MRRCVVRDERGFTLPEVLVAMVMMLTVMFALYSIFDMSLQVFSFGNNKVEAVESARVGVSKMEREIRAAYPEDKANGEQTLLYSGTDSNTIVFGNDTNGDREITTSSPDEQITYEVDGTTLERDRQAAVENVSSLNFDYQDNQGNSVSHDVAEIVEINLTVKVDEGSPNEGTQTIITDVSLRNRAS